MTTEFRILREEARIDPQWAVIEKIWNELNTPYSPDARLSDLSPGQRAIYSLQWIRSEVVNGGFDQCFSNPAGYLLPDARAGATLFESREWSELLSEAESVFSDPYPKDTQRRQELLEDLSPDALALLDRLDDRFYELDDDDATTSLDLLFTTYINTHPDEFFVPAASEEDACEALLRGARQLVNEPPPRRLDLAEDLLLEAVNRSRSADSSRIASLAESLLAQLPDLRT
jgi:hypothetical protein